MLSTYDLSNAVKDVSPILPALNFQDKYKLLSYVKIGAPRKSGYESNTVGWIDSPETLRRVAFVSADTNVVTVDSSDAAKLGIGQILIETGTANTFKITGINGVSATVSGLNSATLAVSGDFDVVGAPVINGSDSGVEAYWQGEAKENFTQIFRRDAKLAGSTLAQNTYDYANQMNTQIQFAIEQIREDMNDSLWLGYKEKRTASNTVGRAGGLYEFGVGKNDVNANSAQLSVDLINACSKAIMDKGGQPNTIVINGAVAPKLSKLYESQRYLAREDNTIGQFVTKIVDAYGNTLQVVLDNRCPISDAWILDIGSIELVPIEGRALTASDSTNPAFDGISEKIIGEYTSFFRDAYKNVGRVYGFTIA